MERTGKPRRGRKRPRLRRAELGVIGAAGERAYYDALHQHFLDLAHERLKDPRYRALLEEFLIKTHRFLGGERI